MVASGSHHSFAVLPDGDDLYDLLGGEFVVRNVPDLNHGAVVTELFGLLIMAQHAGYGYAFTDPHAVALDYPAHGDASQDMTHPDLFFLRIGREKMWRGKRVVEGIPDLVIEVQSPSTRGFHAPGGKLWSAYERNGLPAYWIANPRARTIEQYALLGESSIDCGYGRPTVLRADDTITSSLFPGVSLPVSRVFRNVVVSEQG